MPTKRSRRHRIIPCIQWSWKLSPKRCRRGDLRCCFFFLLYRVCPCTVPINLFAAGPKCIWYASRSLAHRVWWHADTCEWRNCLNYGFAASNVGPKFILIRLSGRLNGEWETETARWRADDRDGAKFLRNEISPTWSDQLHQTDAVTFRSPWIHKSNTGTERSRRNL